MFILNYFSYSDHYYHRPKYWLFLLNHPVFYDYFGYPCASHTVHVFHPFLSYLRNIINNNYTGNILRTYEARSCNHSCSTKPINITYSECTPVALGIRHEMRMRRMVICDLAGSLIFFSHCLIEGTIFEEKNSCGK
jgi:hypothetical protein